MIRESYIIFFDGQCGLCGRFIHFVFKRDRQSYFLYAPLQGSTAQLHLKKEDQEDLKSIILLKKGIVLKESLAIKNIFQTLYPRYGWVLSFIPSWFFNVFYRFIAKRRYIFFGKKDFVWPSHRPKDLFLP